MLTLVVLQAVQVLPVMDQEAQAVLQAVAPVDQVAQAVQVDQAGRGDLEADVVVDSRIAFQVDP
jgi:hypothetical protein